MTTKIRATIDLDDNWMTCSKSLDLPEIKEFHTILTMNISREQKEKRLTDLLHKRYGANNVSIVIANGGGGVSG